MIGGLVLNAVMLVPYFLAIQAANPMWIGITLYVTIIGATAYYALLATFLASAFPARIRYSGVSLAYQLCATILGGSTPLVAQWILNSTNGSVWGVACFYGAMLALTIVGVWALQRQIARTPATLEGVA